VSHTLLELQNGKDKKITAQTYNLCKTGDHWETMI